MKIKRMLALLLTLAMVLTLAACSGKDTPAVRENPETPETAENPAETEAAAPKVKSDGYEKFSQLKIGMSRAEVDAILGEPASVDKAYHYYNITVNGQDMELTVWINLGDDRVTYLAGNFRGQEYRAEFADSKTDLSAVNGLETGELDSYEACAAAFKTPGYLSNIDEDGVAEYLWVDATDGYMSVTFRADGTVKTYSGVC